MLPPPSTDASVTDGMPSTIAPTVDPLVADAAPPSTTTAEPESDDPDAFAAELDQLIQAGGPNLEYQPIVHGLSDTVIGYEALARFHGDRPTGMWFKLADQVGMSADLELTILRQVVNRLDQSDGQSYLACNLSPSIISDPRLNQIASMHRSDRLVIELTGRDTACELRMLTRELEALRDDRKRVGVHVASLDQRTLGCLVMEQPDMVKLDVELTRRLASGEETFAPEFFRRCRHEGIFVVAVGIETNEDLQAVEAIGADAYQGFLIDNRA